VISSIIHITHKYDDDNEPWPIEIEDHNGVMHAVSLEPGQMLFYESAVCLHGRRKKFKGQYYGSLFVHYQPVDPQIWNYTIEVSTDSDDDDGYDDDVVVVVDNEVTVDYFACLSCSHDS